MEDLKKFIKKGLLFLGIVIGNYKERMENILDYFESWDSLDAERVNYIYNYTKSCLPTNGNDIAVRYLSSDRHVYAIYINVSPEGVVWGNVALNKTVLFGFNFKTNKGQIETDCFSKRKAYLLLDEFISYIEYESRYDKYNVREFTKKLAELGSRD